MAHTSSRGDISERPMSLKRKRDSSDYEDLENMPPAKQSPKLGNDDCEPLHLVLQSASSYDSTSDDDVSQHITIATETGKSVYSETVYSGDSLFSPPSISELPSSVLTPLENVQRGESTPHSNKRQSKPPTSAAKRKCPLPSLTWGDSTDVWSRMCECDAISTSRRTADMFSRHPGLQLRMRAILLDWLNEVCEVYKLHRETFHLTVDYVDRYLSNTKDVQKGRLQLIGITCLFIAAKVEEVYPPKIGEFAYVTDGACTHEEILSEEVVILKALNWSITPITINGWLNVYMQLSSESRSARRRLLTDTDSSVNALRGYTFVFPQYSSLEFSISGQLVDLAVLHVEVNLFSYSVVAAAAIAHTFNKDLAVRVSGFQWEDIEVCYIWLLPFAEVLRADGGSWGGWGAAGRAAPHGDADFMAGSGGLALICPDVNLDESHRIQVHNICLDMFDKVNQQLSDAECITADSSAVAVEATPTAGALPPHVASPLTPPESGRKSPRSPTQAQPTPTHASLTPHALHIAQD